MSTNRKHGAVTALKAALADGRLNKTIPQMDVFTLGAANIDHCLGGGMTPHGVHEVRCGVTRDTGAMLGFTLGVLARNPKPGSILWIEDPAALIDGGILFPAGLQQFGINPDRLIVVRPRTLSEAMWAFDEAVKCEGVAATVLHIRGNPQAFDITVSRRLMLRARTSGTPGILLRQGGQAEPSAVTTRWCVAPFVSAPDILLPLGLGQTQFHITLERNRLGSTGCWVMGWNHNSRAFEDVNIQTAHFAHPFSTSGNRSYRSTQVGQVVALDRAS